MKRNQKILLVLVLLLSSMLVIGATTTAKKIKSKSVMVHTAKATIGVGDIVTLDATMNPVNSTDSLKWSTSNKKVATVNKYGVVSAVSAGKATITVKTSSGKTSKCTVTVKTYLPMFIVICMLT